MNFHPDFVDAYLLKIKCAKKLKIRRRKFTFRGVTYSFEIRENKEDRFPYFNMKQYLKVALQLIRLPSNHRTKVNVRIIDTLERKYLPTKEASIDAEHLNSAYCYPNSNQNDLNIVIYRREEVNKVLIHELLHLFNTLPFSSFESLEKLESELEMEKSYETIQETLSVNEAYVELNALLVHCNVIAHKTGKRVSEIIESEYSFSTEQVKKLLAQQNTTINVITTGQLKWNETTHAFSYFVLKHILLHNYLKKSRESLIINLTIYPNNKRITNHIRLTKERRIY